MKQVKQNRLSFLLRLLSALFLLVSFVCSFFMTDDLLHRWLIISFTILSLLLMIATFFVGKKIKPLLVVLLPVSSMVVFSMIFHASVYDLTDFFQGIKMFGNPDHAFLDIFSCACAFLSVLLLLILSFFKEENHA